MHKKRIPIFLIILVIVGFLISQVIPKEKNNKASSFRALPRPIAEEPLLITSAGQNTDSYIVKDIANKLMMDNYFVPMATKESLLGIKSVVMVIGYSKVGINLKDMKYKEEKKRVEELLSYIKEKELTLITIYLRGSEMLSEENKDLLKVVSEQSDYLIVVNSYMDDGYYIKLAEQNQSPLTIVKDIREVSEPFVSAFR